MQEPLKPLLVELRGRGTHGLAGAAVGSDVSVVGPLGNTFTMPENDETAVLGAMFEHCDFLRDIELVHGPLDILDHAAARLGAGQKLGIDATRKIPGEEVRGVPVGRPEQTAAGDARAAADLAEQVVGRSGIVDLAVPSFGRGRCVFAAVDKTRPGQGCIFLKAEGRESLR